MIPVWVFLLVIGSATLHATWNFFGRKAKGNIPLSWAGNAIAIACLLPIVLVFNLYSKKTSDWRLGAPWFVISAIDNCFYNLLLFKAYQYGEVSLVYPISRGTSVGLTSLVSQFLLDEKLSAMGWGGVGGILLGILIISRCVRLPEKYDFLMRFEYSINLPKHCCGYELKYSFSEEETLPEVPGKEPSDLMIEDRSIVDPKPNVLPQQSDEKKIELVAISQDVDVKVEDETPDVEVIDVPRCITCRPIIALLKKRKTLTILMALACGVTTTIYTNVDKKGVEVMEPVTYMFMEETIKLILLSPIVFYFHPKELEIAKKHLKKYALLIGPPSIIAYLMILFAFQEANVSYIVAMREVAVVIGCIMGFLFLKEKINPYKIVGMLCIIAGLILVKMA
eukprot:TRINITY_DN8153_c0_g1_i1.p1 TRINITY_DN8153_c0_g1~~TRINITY_DN8153_c0_g1_i1.p1  ORF type:complete len:394 (-),score=78.09 TRINITY_DN8153_c0_g1_i1:58-1239(-)